MEHWGELLGRSIDFYSIFFLEGGHLIHAPMGSIVKVHEGNEKKNSVQNKLLFNARSLALPSD
jgi:hypothetical protein